MQKVGTLQQPHNALRATLQSNFDLATRSEDPPRSGITAMPRDNGAGLICSPDTLGPASTFRMVLPAHPRDRRGVLAALPPDGNLRIIYVSYGADTDIEDLNVPYSSIDWQIVQTRNQFSVGVKDFKVIDPNSDGLAYLFREPGIYQFALLNSVNRDLLDAKGAAFWVIAGCVVRYQP